MQTTTLGRTGLEVSRLGAGLSEIGEVPTSVAQAGQVLNAALDGGITFLDTAACYGNSEELIGRTVAHRRNEYVLATKCGHATGGHSGQPWTAQVIRDSIDRSLRLMKTDHLDLVQLHSCGVATLEQGEVVQALLKARDTGKTRFVGYSGDNAAASWAVESGLFDTLQTSFSLVDQHARTRLFQQASSRGIGIIIKRPIGNGVWGATASDRPYTDEYFKRAQAMQALGPVPGAPDDTIRLAMGFLFAHPEVGTAIVGTRNPAHMLANIQMLDGDLSIPEAVVQDLYRRFDQLDQQWEQMT